MLLLFLGVVLWSAIHFVPVLAIDFRAKLITKHGENVYKSIFSVIVLISLAMIIFGWRSADPAFFYHFEGLRPVTGILMLVAVILFGAARRPTAIKRFIRHPQLVSVIVWAFAHLLINGDSRSWVLFGGLGVWAAISIPLTNKRDGEWVKPEAPGMRSEIIGMGITVAILVVLVMAHPWYAGVPIAG
ncbi:MAG: NnrU family protein [Hyphomicrobiales bacterium]